jgi:dsRNA-specific ribonuclease
MALDKIQQLREEAWIGDAVLALRARLWLLESQWKDHPRRHDFFKEMTGNQYLSSLGRGDATSVEGHIGRIYQDRGLGEAFLFIDEHILPVFAARLRRSANR